MSDRTAIRQFVDTATSRAVLDILRSTASQSAGVPAMLGGPRELQRARNQPTMQTKLFQTLG